MLRYVFFVRLSEKLKRPPPPVFYTYQISVVCKERKKTRGESYRKRKESEDAEDEEK